MSVYLDIKLQEVIPDSSTAVMKYAKDKRLAILLCIDSNCHSSSFGTDDNKRGEVLDDFIAAHNLKIENKGTEYTFETTFFFFCRPTANSLVALSTWCKWREIPAHLDSTCPKSYSKYKRWSS